ncbi:hypothetical protein CYMTET_38319 [Cymbomonas tetramitiformis]|nr:hypothetical protein CYMTET_38319 [Cymbomonas tetramitiformis]
MANSGSSPAAPAATSRTSVSAASPTASASPRPSISAPKPAIAQVNTPEASASHALPRSKSSPLENYTEGGPQPQKVDNVPTGASNQASPNTDARRGAPRTGSLFVSKSSRGGTVGEPSKRQAPRRVSISVPPTSTLATEEHEPVIWRSIKEEEEQTKKLEVAEKKTKILEGMSQLLHDKEQTIIESEKRLHEGEEQIASEYQSTIQELESEIAELQRAMSVKDEVVRSAEKQLQEKNQTLTEVEAQLLKTEELLVLEAERNRAKLDTLMEEKDGLEKQVVALENELDSRDEQAAIIIEQRERIDELENEAALRGDGDDTDDEHEELHQQVGELQDQIGFWRKELESREERLAAFEQQTESVKTEAHQAMGDAESLEHELATCKRELEQERLKVEAKDQQLEEVRTQVTEHYTTSVRDTEAHLERVNNSAVEKEKDLLHKTAELADSSIRIAQLEKDLSDKDEMLAKTSGDISTWQSIMINTESRATALLADVERISENLLDAEKKIQEKEEYISELEREVQVLTTEAEERAAELSRREKDLAEMHIRLEKSTVTLEQTKGQVAAQKTKIATTEKELTESRDAMNADEKALTALSSELAEVKIERDTLVSDLAASGEKVTGLSTQLEESKEQVLALVANSPQVVGSAPQVASAELVELKRQLAELLSIIKECATGVKPPPSPHSGPSERRRSSIVIPESERNVLAKIIAKVGERVLNEEFNGGGASEPNLGYARSNSFEGEGRTWAGTSTAKEQPSSAYRASQFLPAGGATPSKEPSPQPSQLAASPATPVFPKAAPEPVPEPYTAPAVVRRYSIAATPDVCAGEEPVVETPSVTPPPARRVSTVQDVRAAVTGDDSDTSHSEEGSEMEASGHVWLSVPRLRTPRSHRPAPAGPPPAIARRLQLDARSRRRKANSRR